MTQFFRCQFKSGECECVCARTPYSMHGNDIMSVFSEVCCMENGEIWDLLNLKAVCWWFDNISLVPNLECTIISLKCITIKEDRTKEKKWLRKRPIFNFMARIWVNYINFCVYVHTFSRFSFNLSFFANIVSFDKREFCMQLPCRYIYPYYS